MQFHIPIIIPPLQPRITYADRIFLTGSCFTEHIGKYLQDVRMQTLQNPHGILFDPVSISNALRDIVGGRVYEEADLFSIDDIRYAWSHHGRFSGINADTVLESMNAGAAEATMFLKNASHVIITLGSSFVYRLSPVATTTRDFQSPAAVANCHKAPASWFRKEMLEIEESFLAMREAIVAVKAFNPSARFIFTVSPVRHLRHGVAENNLSKARLLETVHRLLKEFPGGQYFPAYELVTDVLRDYRFYDADLVHPNYAATTFVMEKFAETYIDPVAAKTMDDVRKIAQAFNHRPMHPDSMGHREFMKRAAESTAKLMQENPTIDLSQELEYFRTGY